jgi:hypothetical protein
MSRDKTHEVVQLHCSVLLLIMMIVMSAVKLQDGVSRVMVRAQIRLLTWYVRVDDGEDCWRKS